MGRKTALESLYGNCVNVYSGRGTLTLTAGRTLSCRFVAGQLLNGEIILLLTAKSETEALLAWWGATNFRGITSSGIEVASVGDLRVLHSEGARVTARANMLEAKHSSRSPKRIHFGVTNFEFVTSPTGVTTGVTRLLEVELKDKLSTTLSLRPLNEYNSISRRIRTLRSIEVTCEAVAEIKSSSDTSKLEKSINHFCRLASIARGTRVEWVYCDNYDSRGTLIKRIHAARITKPFCPLQVIDKNSNAETKSFIETTFKTYIDKREDFGLETGTIDSYLDAKSEADFLEIRAAKLAVCLEKLKSVFIKRYMSGTSEFIVKTRDFDALVPQIKDEIERILAAAGVVKKKRADIAGAGKIKFLNRKSFEYYISKLIKEIKLKVSPSDVKLFVRCRNKLVHQGEFYAEVATTEEIAECPPLPTAKEEFFFMLDFLDRIFLKLVGYSGPYISHRYIVTGDVRKELLP